MNEMNSIIVHFLCKYLKTIVKLFYDVFYTILYVILYIEFLPTVTHTHCSMIYEPQLISSKLNSI